MKLRFLDLMAATAVLAMSRIFCFPLGVRSVNLVTPSAFMAAPMSVMPWMAVLASSAVRLISSRMKKFLASLISSWARMTVFPSRV